MTRTLAVMMVKNEGDIIRGAIEHLVDEVHGVYVADNGSADGTRDILSDLQRQFPNHLHVSDDPDPAYYQSAKMTALAAKAVADSGEDSPWILPVDADELWYWEGDRICVELSEFKGVRIVEADLYNHFPSGLDGEIGHAFEKIEYRQREPGALPKVAFRWDATAVIHQGNHGVTLANPSQPLREGLKIRHFPYRTLQQFINKAITGAKAYAATDLPPSEGAHWREYGALYERGGREALQEVFERWFRFPAPVTAGLVYDPAPYKRWQRSL